MPTEKEYKALESLYETELAIFTPTSTPCEYMSHGKKFTVTTPKGGEVAFMLDRDIEVKRGEPACISIFARFDDAKTARALGFDCNMFNGKWNHHFLYSKAMIQAVFSELREKAF